MKYLILLILSCSFSVVYCGESCSFHGNKTDLYLYCNPNDPDLRHVIKDEYVICGTDEVLRENIKHIGISSCTFDDFHLFKNFTTLRYAYNLYNTKTVGKDTFIGMNQLEYFKIAHSYANVLESAFSELPNLREVVLKYSTMNLSELAFKGAHQLRSLTIANIFNSSPRGFFRYLGGLEYLYLQLNVYNPYELKNIDFTGLDKLKFLILTENEYQNLAENSLPTSLKYLRITNSQLDDIGVAPFSKLKQLVFLDFQNNRIWQLTESSFSGLINLRSLSLKFNPIRRIEDETFSSLKNLIKLDLAHNSLQVLDENTFKGLDNLKYLRLQHNNIHSINVNTFSGLTKLIQLDLSEQRTTEYWNWTIDLNAFPQFVDLKTRTVLYTPIPKKPSGLEVEELVWLDDYKYEMFGCFTSDREADNLINLNNLTIEKPSQLLVLGNLDLSYI